MFQICPGRGMWTSEFYVVLVESRCGAISTSVCGFLYKTLLYSTESKMSILYRRQCGMLVGAPRSKHNTGASFLEWSGILKVNSGCSSPVSPATPGFCSNLLPFLVILFKCILLYGYIKRRRMVMNLGFASLWSFLLQSNNKR